MRHDRRRSVIGPVSCRSPLHNLYDTDSGTPVSMNLRRPPGIETSPTRNGCASDSSSVMVQGYQDPYGDSRSSHDESATHHASHHSTRPPPSPPTLGTPPAHRPRKGAPPSGSRPWSFWTALPPSSPRSLPDLPAQRPCSFRASPHLAGSPRWRRPSIRFLFVRAVLRLPLPSGPTSRWAPLPSASRFGATSARLRLSFQTQGMPGTPRRTPVEFTGVPRSCWMCFTSQDPSTRAAPKPRARDSRWHRSPPG
jgi:hypothetical protein